MLRVIRNVQNLLLASDVVLFHLNLLKLGEITFYHLYDDLLSKYFMMSHAGENLICASNFTTAWDTSTLFFTEYL